MFGAFRDARRPTVAAGRVGLFKEPTEPDASTEGAAVTGVVATPTSPSAADVQHLPAGWWARGLTLAERCALPALPGPATTERAERRLARWRQEHRLDESGQFARRLAAARHQPRGSGVHVLPLLPD
jgi:hypothetical protein